LTRQELRQKIGNNTESTIELLYIYELVAIAEKIINKQLAKIHENQRLLNHATYQPETYCRLFSMPYKGIFNAQIGRTI
jgi:hypothetical protein